MEYINVDKDKLLSILNENLGKHISEVEELQEERANQLHDYMVDFIGGLESGCNRTKEVKDFPLPVDYSENYRKAIEMVEMSVDESIKLSSSDFDNYVRDNWHWKNSFNFLKGSYGKL